MTEEKLIEFVTKLEAKTLSGNVKWEETAATDVFQATLSSFVIRICRSEARDGSTDLEIDLVSKDGTIIESLSDGQFLRMVRKYQSAGALLEVNAHGVMESIFTSARRMALGVDKALDDVLSELNGESPH